jgi:tetratricopeptide (TPR) repeat protein
MEWDYLGDTLAVLQVNCAKVTLFDLQTKAVSYLDVGTVDASHLCWARRSALLAVATGKGNVVLYDVPADNKVVIQGKHSRRIVDGVWVSDAQLGDVLALASGDRTISVSDAAGGHVAQFGLKAEPLSVSVGRQKTDGSGAGSSVLCVNAGGRSLVLQSLEAGAAPVELSFQEQYGLIQDLVWFGDGYVLVCFKHGHVVSVSSHLGEARDEIMSAKLHSSAAHAVAYNKALQKLVSAGNDGLRVISTLTWREEPADAVRFSAEQGEPVTLRASPDEQILSVCTSRGYVFNYLLFVPTLSACSPDAAFVAHLHSLQQLAITSVVPPALDADAAQAFTPGNGATSFPLLPPPDAAPAEDPAPRLRRYLLSVAVEPSVLGLGPHHAVVGLNSRLWVYNLNLHRPDVLGDAPRAPADTPGRASLRSEPLSRAGTLATYAHPASLLCEVDVPARVLRVECSARHLAILAADGRLYVYALLGLAQAHQAARKPGQPADTFTPAELLATAPPAATQSLCFPAPEEPPAPVADFELVGDCLCVASAAGVLRHVDLASGDTVFTYTHTPSGAGPAVGLRRARHNKFRSRAALEDAAGHWWVLNVKQRSLTAVPGAPAQVDHVLWDRHDALAARVLYLHDNRAHAVHTYALALHHAYLHLHREPCARLSVTADVLHDLAALAARGGVLYGPSAVGQLHYTLTRSFFHAHVVFNADLIRQTLGLSAAARDRQCSVLHADEPLLLRLVSPARCLATAAECARLGFVREAWAVLHLWRVRCEGPDWRWADYTHCGPAHLDAMVPLQGAPAAPPSVAEAWAAQAAFLEAAAAPAAVDSVVTAQCSCAAADGAAGHAVIVGSGGAAGAQARCTACSDPRRVRLFVQMALAVEYAAANLADMDTAQAASELCGNHAAVACYARLAASDDRAGLLGFVHMFRGDLAMAQDCFLRSTAPLEAVYMLSSVGQYANAAALAKTFLETPALMRFVEEQYYMDRICESGSHPADVEAPPEGASGRAIAAAEAARQAASLSQEAMDAVLATGMTGRIAVQESIAELLALAGEAAEATRDWAAARDAFAEGLEVCATVTRHYEQVCADMEFPVPAPGAPAPTGPALDLAPMFRRFWALRERLLLGTARALVEANNAAQAVEALREVRSAPLLEETALLLEQHKHLPEAAEVYIRAGNHDRAVMLFLQTKLIPRAKALLPLVRTPKTHAVLGKALEAAGDWAGALAAYTQCDDLLAQVRLLLSHLGDPQRAFTLVRESRHGGAALLLAEHCIAQGHMSAAVEFLVIAQQQHRARELAVKHGVLDAYAEAVGAGGSAEDYLAIAEYMLAQRAHLRAGDFYARAGQYVRAVQCFLLSGEREGVLQAIRACRAAHEAAAPELAAMVALVQESITRAAQGGEGAGALGSEDTILLFRLYVAIREYVQAAATAIIIAGHEQNKGSYAAAHSLLATATTELAQKGVPVPIELSRALLLLHSYLIVKRWVRLGDHHTAALLLTRVARNIARFPAHTAPILTSAVVECQRAGMRRTSCEFAQVLTRPEHRADIPEKYKKKIEMLARRPEQDEVDEPVSPCPFCSFPLANSALDCPSCSNVAPWCIVTGMHVRSERLSCCPHCRCPVQLDAGVAAADAGEACPMCAGAWSQATWPTLGADQVRAWLRSGSVIVPSSAHPTDVENK